MQAQFNAGSWSQQHFTALQLLAETTLTTHNSLQNAPSRHWWSLKSSWTTLSQDKPAAEATDQTRSLTLHKFASFKLSASSQLGGNEFFQPQTLLTTNTLTTSTLSSPPTLIPYQRYKLNSRACLFHYQTLLFILWVWKSIVMSLKVHILLTLADWYWTALHMNRVCRHINSHRPSRD